MFKKAKRPRYLGDMAGLSPGVWYGLPPSKEHGVTSPSLLLQAATRARWLRARRLSKFWRKSGVISLVLLSKSMTFNIKHLYFDSCAPAGLRSRGQFSSALVEVQACSPSAVTLDGGKGGGLRKGAEADLQLPGREGVVGREPGMVGLGWKIPLIKDLLLTNREEGRGRSEGASLFRAM